MRSSNTRIKLFGACDTITAENRVNKWLLDNPENEIHKMELAVRKGIYVMVVYEPPGEVK